MGISSKGSPTRVGIWFLGLIILCTSWSLGVQSWAATFYVSDTTLETILRAGPQANYRIIAAVQVGEQVTLIREENGWAEVALQDGRKGWTLMRYLSERPPWRVTAEKLTAENQQIQEQISNIERSNQKLSEENSELEKKLDIVRRDLESVRQEYETLKKGSAKYLNLKRAYENIQSKAQQVKENAEELGARYEKLKSATRINWMLSVVGVLVLGWLPGLIMGRRRRRRYSDQYRF